MEDQRLKQWIADFHRAFLDCLVRRAADREPELSRLYAEPCPAHEGCVRVVLAALVMSHSTWANAAPAAVAAAVLNRTLSLLSSHPAAENRVNPLSTTKGLPKVFPGR